MSILTKENLTRYREDYTRNIGTLRRLQAENNSFRKRLIRESATSSYGMIERIKLYILHNEIDQKHTVIVLDLLQDLIVACEGAS